jgi:hypothetical protein
LVASIQCCCYVIFDIKAVFFSYFNPLKSTTIKETTNALEQQGKQITFKKSKFTTSTKTIPQISGKERKMEMISICFRQ